VFVNNDERIETSVDLAHSDELQRTDLSLIHAIGLGPGVAAQIGSLRRTNKTSSGLWVANFDPPATGENAVRQALERLVIAPWIERRSMQAVDRTYDVTHRSLRRSNADRLAEIEELRNYLVNCAGPDRSRVDRIKSIVHALNYIEQTIEKSHPSIAHVPPPPAPSPTLTDDLIQRAIEMRKRLQGLVKFVTSAEWAEWRGIHSNSAAAALRMYRVNKRVFGVRVNKQLRYPMFQFADDAEPLPVIRDILRVAPDTAQGWPLLGWFEAKSRLLQGRKPSDVVVTEPQAALHASRRFFLDYV
jgi:hypothetical protein